jgi:RNA-dependent RNA polymerase
MNNDILGRIDNSHLALSDSSSNRAYDPQCLKLSELHGIAVDFVKTGITPPLYNITFAKAFPDFMERSHKDFTYESKTLLGFLYREAKSEIEKVSGRYRTEGTSKNLVTEINEDFLFGDWERYVGGAWDVLYEYYKTIKSIITLFEIESEFEVFSGNVIKLHKQKKGKKKRNTDKIEEKLIDAVNTLVDKFTQIFYGHEESEDAIKQNGIENDPTPEEKAKASAWYAVSYFDPSKIQPHLVAKLCQNEGYEKNISRLKYYEPEKYIGLPWFVVKSFLFKIKSEKPVADQILPRQRSVPAS